MVMVLESGFTTFCGHGLTILLFAERRKSFPLPTPLCIVLHLQLASHPFRTHEAARLVGVFTSKILLFCLCFMVVIIAQLILSPLYFHF